MQSKPKKGRKGTPYEGLLLEKIAPKSFLYDGERVVLAPGDRVARCTHDTEPFHWLRVPPTWRTDVAHGSLPLPTWFLHCHDCWGRYCDSNRVGEIEATVIGTLFEVEEGAED